MPHRLNATYVSNADALAAWTPIAREVLLAAAGRYRAVVSVDDLAAVVQERSGIRHDQPASAWIGKLLDRVAVATQRLGEPPLAALCLSEVDDAARAEDRLLCYRAYADDLPADGGSPEVHRRVAARRVSGPRPATTPRVRAAAPSLREVTCPSCWMIVAARPTCSSCGEPLPS